MKRLAIAVFLAVLAGHAQLTPRGSKAAGKKAKVAEDPREMVNHALALARSANPADHEELGRMLGSPTFLKALDSEKEYDDTRRRLRIARVLEALATNGAPTAASLLVQLTGVREFTDEPRRTELLIAYTANIRPAPQPLVNFWDAHSQPEDGYTHFTINTLAKNGTGPALDLLERKLADPAHPDDDKQFWMQTIMLPHRNETPMLLMMERLLAGRLPANLRPVLVESIFDYNVDWYPEAAIVKAPDRREASPEAREILRRIGHLALNTVSLTEHERAAVEKVLMELGPG